MRLQHAAEGGFAGQINVPRPAWTPCAQVVPRQSVAYWPLKSLNFDKSDRRVAVEHTKFETRAAKYHEDVSKILNLGIDPVDFIHHNAAFNGKENIARFLAFYELYKGTLGLSGHIAEVGIWKGASLLYFAKLIELFEPHSYTQVHGFDWFEGMKPGSEFDGAISEGSYRSDYEALLELIDIQGIGGACKVHKLDVTKELVSFLNRHPSLRFKLVFLDAGTYQVVSTCIPLFWDRLQKGGILVLDQYNECRATGETVAACEALPKDARIQTFPWAKQPSAYIVK